MRILTTLFSLAFICSSLSLSAQQSINSAGVEATGNGSASFSIGQVFYVALEGTGGETAVFQGVQIPYEVFGSFCPEDINQDGIVDIADFVQYNSAFGTTCSGCPEDINNDGIVDIADFIQYNSAFGQECDPSP